MGEPTARQQEVPRQLMKLVRGAREWYKWSTAMHERCTRRSGARDCGVVHDGTRVEVPTARQQEVPRQLRKLVSGAREWYESRWCTRLRSGARWYTSRSSDGQAVGTSASSDGQCHDS